MSPDVAHIFTLLPRSGNVSRRRGRLPSPPDRPNGGSRLIWPFALAFGRTLPFGSLERVTIECLTRAEASSVIRVERYSSLFIRS
jgi:hypothetical protein